MNITLIPLESSHFTIMLEWLNTPHVHMWWNPEITWTRDKIIEKYISYTQGYKIENNQKKAIHAFVIEVDRVPVGYFQFYNAYDFERNPPLNNFPKSLGAFDIFIGNSDYLHKGIGPQALQKGFLLPCNTYSYIVADVNIENSAARKTYEKVGFIVVEIDEIADNIRMIKKN